jgi:hypothetical protein
VTKRLVGASVEHGPDTACYSGGPGEPYYQPWLQCLCGWVSERQPSWEDVGAAFDAHLAEAEKKGKR